MTRVRLLAALLFVIPLGASATIYQWTDETGHTVLGNHVPETARNVRVVMKEDATPANTNRELEERVARLERQVQAQQYVPPAPYPNPPAQYPVAMPPVPTDYYGAAPYHPATYPPPPYYPFGYAYGFTVVRPVGFAPRFASRPFASLHHGGFHRR